MHADPHYGNMLYDPEDRLVLLDFGLVTRLTPSQREAMATAVAAIVAEDWPALLEAFREIGLVPRKPNIWCDARTKEPVSGLLPGVWVRSGAPPWRALMDSQVPCSEEEFSASFVAALEECTEEECSAGVKPCGCSV